MAAVGRTKLSNIKLQCCAFDTPLRSIYMPSMATVQIGVRLVVLATVQIGIRLVVLATVQIGIRPRVAAI